MTIRQKDIRKGSPMSNLLHHTCLWLPPSDVDFYTVAAAAASIVAGFPFVVPSAAGARAWGGASCINLTATGATGFTNAMTVEVEVVGRDENHELIRERISITGNAGATQQVVSANFFSSVDTVTVTSTVGAVTGSAATFQVGIGTGTNGDLIRVPNPFRGIAATSIVLAPMYTAFVPFTVTSTAPDHRFLQVQVVTAGLAQTRLAAAAIFGNDPRAFMEL